MNVVYTVGVDETTDCMLTPYTCTCMDINMYMYVVYIDTGNIHRTYMYIQAHVVVCDRDLGHLRKTKQSNTSACAFYKYRYTHKYIHADV